MRRCGISFSRIVWVFVAILVCAGIAVGAEKHCGKDDDFDKWRKALPEDYGLTSRDWARLRALRLRDGLMRGGKKGRLQWLEKDGKGRMIPGEGFTKPFKFSKFYPKHRAWSSYLAVYQGDEHFDPGILGLTRDELRDIVRAAFATEVNSHRKAKDAGYYVNMFYMLEYPDLLTPEDKAYLESVARDRKQAFIWRLYEHDTEYVNFIRVWGGIENRKKGAWLKWHSKQNALLDGTAWTLNVRMPRNILMKDISGKRWKEIKDQHYSDMVNAYSTVHLVYCTEIVEGKPVNEWGKGSAISADFTLSHRGGPDVIYATHTAMTACNGAAFYLRQTGEIPPIYLYNFDYIVRRFFLPLTLWRNRIWPIQASYSNKSRGEHIFYYQADYLATYLKLRHRDPRAARLEQDSLAFQEWWYSRNPHRKQDSPKVSHSYIANAFGKVAVKPGADKELQAWLAGNYWFWRVGAATINRTPRRFAEMSKCEAEWAVIPRNGGWAFSANSRFGMAPVGKKNLLTSRLSQSPKSRHFQLEFFGGGFARVGAKEDSWHGMAVLPDECTVVMFSSRKAGASDDPRFTNYTQTLLSTAFDKYTRRLYYTGGCRVLTNPKTADAVVEPGPLAGPWLNVEDRLGYIIAYPEKGGTFKHGAHPKCFASAKKPRDHEGRMPLAFPNTSEKNNCVILICDQDAAATRQLSESGRIRRLDTTTPDLTAVRVPGQDGSEYVVAANMGTKSAGLTIDLPAGKSFAPVAGVKITVEGKRLSLAMPPSSVGIVQIRGVKDTGNNPHVRLMDPQLNTLFLEGNSHTLKAGAAGLDGVEEVRFLVRQNGIFAEPRVLGSAKKAPYEFTWTFEKSDRGKYAEIWAQAVGPGGEVRDSSHALVMVKP